MDNKYNGTEDVHVTLLFFAKSRELTERNSKEVQLPRLVTREDLISSIIDLFPSKAESNIQTMADDVTVITPDQLRIEKVMALAACPSAGAISLFVGTTRDNFDGKTVVRLEYEAYIPMASSELRKICKQTREKWDIHKIVIYHRIGVVPVGEASVMIAISSAHRKESLEAVQYCIDTLKATVPIWKKEVYEEGEAKWKENKECRWREIKSSTV